MGPQVRNDILMYHCHIDNDVTGFTQTQEDKNILVILSTSFKDLLLNCENPYLSFLMETTILS